MLSNGTSAAVAPPGSQRISEPSLFSLPGGDIFDLYPRAAQTDQIVRSLASVDDVISMAGFSRLPYSMEAIRHRFLTRAILSAEDRAKLTAAPIGLNQFPLLRDFREVLRRNAESTRTVTEESRLVLWGVPPKPSRAMFDGITTLLRAPWIQAHLASHPEKYNGLDVRDLVWDWVLACGIRHHKTAQAVFHRLLAVAPAGPFVNLDQAAARMARDVVPHDKFLAVRFFRCLQRVAAYHWQGSIIWPSAWLRGAGQSRLAIKGASGASSQLTALLKTHVLSQVAGHSAGRRSARYQLKIPLWRGPFDVKDFAEVVGVEVDVDGVPRRSR